jgi:sugar/nucleoside kinase (ribokinase family)
VILVAGDLMLDIMVLSALRAEEQSRGILIRPGGSAGNTAAWAASLDVPVTFVGTVGPDEVGTMLRHELESHGVKTAIDTVHGFETGAVAVDVGDTGDRIMRSARGANEALSPAMLDAVHADDLRIIHLTGYALLGPPPGFALLEAASRLARQKGALLSFDPSSRGVIDRIGVRRLLDAAHSCGVDVFLPNWEEAACLTDADSPRTAAADLSALFPRVFVKDGARGAAYGASGECHDVPITPLTALDTTGAGDAFNAGVLAGLHESRSPADACRLGHTIAARAIMRYGGRPPREDLA